MASNRSLHRPTALTVTSIKVPGWHSDGGGLFLEVDPSGRKRWVLRITVNGRRRDFGLGPLNKVSLAKAREAASEYRSKAYEGLDPVAEKQERRLARPKVAPTFESAARSVYQLRKANWSNGKHVDQWINTLIDYAFPKIGKKPVDRVVTADVLAILEPIWTSKPETARRVRQRLYTVLDWARAAGHRSGDNPVDLLGDALPKIKASSRHHAALPYSEVGSFIAKLRASSLDIMSKLAFEFLILTAARTTEVRAARWGEIDQTQALWTIPGADMATGRRMKAGREHVVPLSPRALEIVLAARALTPDAETILFPDRDTGKPMSENRFLIARDALGYAKTACTPHGFRSSFRDWASEETDMPSEVAEMALAHAIKSKTEAAYRRGHLLAKRREMMVAWAAFIEPPSSLP